MDTEYDEVRGFEARGYGPRIVDGQVTYDLIEVHMCWDAIRELEPGDIVRVEYIDYTLYDFSYGSAGPTYYLRVLPVDDADDIET